MSTVERLTGREYSRQNDDIFEMREGLKVPGSTCRTGSTDLWGERPTLQVNEAARNSALLEAQVVDRNLQGYGESNLRRSGDIVLQSCL